MRWMFCNRCGTQARPGQKYCAECGESLPPSLEATQPVAVVEGDPPDDDDTVLEPTQPIDVVADTNGDAPGRASDTSDDPGDAADGEPVLPATQPIEISELPPPPAPADAPAPPQLYDMALDEPDLLAPPSPATPATTEQLPPTPPLAPTDELPWIDRDADDGDESEGGALSNFRIGVVSGVGLVAGMAALFGMFTRVVGIRTDARTPAFDAGDWLVADLGTNLPGAMIVALVTLLVGVVGAGFGQRWAAGVAGGAGLAIAGWVALTVGLAERPVEAALDAVGRPSAEAFTVTITRDVGYWVLLAAGALGLLTFVVSLGSAGRDRRRGLNPWIASLGAVSAVVAAAGPMLPQGAASVQDNWSPGSGGLGLPTWFVVGRLVQLGLLAYAGVVGFLLVRRYGLGLAIGGMSVAVWLSVSTLLGLGESPVGPGYANPGVTPTDPALHAVTVVGMIALVGLAIVAVIAAFDQAAREYP